MQLKFERDFFIRQARGSDLLEVVGLVERYHSPKVAAQLKADFANLLTAGDTFFRVLLNSNGVLIGAILAEASKLITLSMNPNFLRKEVRDEINRQLKDWAVSKSGGALIAPRDIIAGDWKAYFKHNGVKVDSKGHDHDVLRFAGGDE